MSSNGDVDAVKVGVLVGGRSRRMGRPKQLVQLGGKPLVEHVVETVEPIFGPPVLLGGGAVPESLASLHRLPDDDGADGPLGGLLAALRWAPSNPWLVIACDQPCVTAEAIDWLVGERRPDRWAILPRLGDGPVEPFLAIYEPQALELVEDLARTGSVGPWRLAAHPRVHCPTPPTELARAWTSINTPEDLRDLDR